MTKKKIAMEQRVRNVARYIADNDATVRSAAKKFGVGKSTIHLDLTERLPQLDSELYKQVRQVLDVNLAERCSRGGFAKNAEYGKNRIKQIFETCIPVDSLTLDSGILEFYSVGNISMGVSYELMAKRKVYIFNLFVDGEYINIPGRYESIYDAVDVVSQYWNEWWRKTHNATCNVDVLD